MDDEGVDITVCTEIERCPGAHGDVFNFNAVQGFELLDQDIQQAGIAQGGGGGQPEVGIG
jgi:hypothetical protein